MSSPLERTIETAANLPSTVGEKAREVTGSVVSGPQKIAEILRSGEDEDPLEARQLQRRRARTLHVEPHEGGWAIRVQGSGELARVTSTREAAERSAKRWARREDRRVFLHRDDGSLERVLSYGES